MGLTRDPLFEVYTPIFNWRDWVKYEPPELTRLVSVLPEIASRLEAVETHLASGGKQPFVRGADRIGGDGVAQLQRSLEAVANRLDKVEQRLVQGK
ncbi:MAG: hypothetical protein U1G07_13040 [Verrucomicrobiota bacterium]